jgi:hypothetical protein
MEILTMSYFTSKYRSNLKKYIIGLSILCGMGPSWAADVAVDVDDTMFSDEEYEHYMALIRELDPEVHATLKQCEKDLGGPCIDQAGDDEDDMVEDGSEATEGYPIMVLKPMKGVPVGAQKQILRLPIMWYKDKMKDMAPRMTTEERQKLLQGIKAVDQGAYDAIIKVDPTGENHIKRSHSGGTWIIASKVDGYPVLNLEPSVVEQSWNEMLCTIAHELSHYVLGHLYETYNLSHRELNAERTSREFKKGKKVAGQLPFTETFERARSRIKENEADRMMIIQFGINLDDAISQAKRLLVKAEEASSDMPHKETFQETHPLWINRIKQFESLRPEVELNKARNVQRKKINWKQLARKYVKKYKEKYGAKQ